MDFFIMNPQIKNLAMDADLFWLNRDTFLSIVKRVNSVQLNKLCLVFDFTTNIDMAQVADLLNYLHSQNFYGNLHLHSGLNSGAQFPSMRGLTYLRVIGICEEFGPTIRGISTKNLSDLVGMKLSSFRDGNLENITFISLNYKKLQYITFRFIWSVNDVEPLFRNLLNLREVIIGRSHYSGEIVLNLRLLNDLRQQIGRTEKVRIYIDEEVYLATKWAHTMDFNFVELKRITARKRQEDFTIFF